MFDMLLHLYSFNLGFCERLAAPIDDAPLWARPAPSLHMPGWILGHLAISTDFAARCVGIERACPASWHKAFGPGGSGTPDPATRPAKEELLTALRSGHERVAAAIARGVDVARLSRPHEAPPLRDTTLTTVGDALAHLLATHEAMHLGQLTMCRRTMGLPALM